MRPVELNPGDIVRLTRAHNPMLHKCLMVVTTPKGFGAVGYVRTTGMDGMPGGNAYYRATFDEMDFVAHCDWIAKEEDDETLHD